MINITLPDGSKKQFESGTTPYQIALSISEGLARNVLSAKVDDKIVSLNYEITNDCNFRLFTWDDQEGKATYWHSTSHVMAAAIEQLYPGVKFGIGPDIENGFYYDIDFMNYSISSDDFPKIEAKMMEIIQSKAQFERKEVTKAEALNFFTQKGDEYKLELIEGLEDGSITFYQTAGFTDLCRGPHLLDRKSVV